MTNPVTGKSSQPPAKVENLDDTSDGKTAADDSNKAAFKDAIDKMAAAEAKRQKHNTKARKERKADDAEDDAENGED